MASKHKLKKIPSSDTMGTIENLLHGDFDGRTKFDFSGDMPIYIGNHIVVTADGSETGWQITKFTWSGDNPTDIQTQYGVWDDRATLSW